jgi:hypothetical protein
MDTLCLKKRLYQVDAPEESVDNIQEKLEKGRSTWGRFFKNNEEFEFFWMLPLNDEQKGKLIAAMYEEKQQLNDILQCKGSEGKSTYHRQRCVECCVTHRPKCAEPYFV